MPEKKGVIYWDASAILSLLFTDCHSDKASTWIEKSIAHLLSSLAYAEVCAVISRMSHDQILKQQDCDTAHDHLIQGPWQRVHTIPDWQLCHTLSKQYRLRGADLWHLAITTSLQDKLPEITLLTFDNRLKEAAMHMKLATHV